MKRSLFVWTFCTCWALCIARLHAAPETWRSMSGTSVEAEYIGMEGDQVILRTDEGNTIKIDALKLDEASRKRVMALGGVVPAAKDQANVANKPNMLTTIKRPPTVPKGEVLAATFTFDAYEALVFSPSADAYIFIKENGQFLADPIRVSPTPVYHDKAAMAWLRRPVQSLVGDPVKTARSIHFKSLRVDGVSSEHYYEFTPTGFFSGYSLKDPVGIRIPSSHRITFVVPPLFREDKNVDGEAGKRYFNPRFTQGLTLAESEGVAASYHMIMRPEKGSTKTHTFKESIGNLSARLKSATIKGGAYGPAQVSIRIRGKNTRLSGYIYSGFALRSGFSLIFMRNKAESAATDRAEWVEFEVR